MITVGIKDKAWLYITDGTVIYSVGEDILNPGERARITKVDMTMEELQAHCKQQGIKLRKQRGFITYTLEFLLMVPTLILIGFVLGRQTGAMIGAGIGCFLTIVPTPFDGKSLRERFNKIDENYSWHCRLAAEREMYKRQQNEANDSLSKKDAEDNCNPD